MELGEGLHGNVTGCTHGRRRVLCWLRSGAIPVDCLVEKPARWLPKRQPLVASGVASILCFLGVALSGVARVQMLPCSVRGVADASWLRRCLDYIFSGNAHSE